MIRNEIADRIEAWIRTYVCRGESDGLQSPNHWHAGEAHGPEEDRKNLLVCTENPHQIGKAPASLAGVFRSVHDALDEIVEHLPFLIGQVGQLDENGLHELVPAP